MNDKDYDNDSDFEEPFINQESLDFFNFLKELIGGVEFDIGEGLGEDDEEL